MIHEILLLEIFGRSAADGSDAHAFRVANLDPYLTNGDKLVIDFTGIRSANSSFVNALISGLFEQHGAETLGKLVFKGCLPTIQVLVQSAVDLGITKHAERVS